MRKQHVAVLTTIALVIFCSDHNVRDARADTAGGAAERAADHCQHNGDEYLPVHRKFWHRIFPDSGYERWLGFNQPARLYSTQYGAWSRVRVNLRNSLRSLHSLQLTLTPLSDLPFRS